MFSLAKTKQIHPLRPYQPLPQPYLEIPRWYLGQIKILNIKDSLRKMLQRKLHTMKHKVKSLSLLKYSLTMAPTFHYDTIFQIIPLVCILIDIRKQKQK